MAESFRLDLSRAATSVEVQPGQSVILRGSFTSAHDGSVIDAATTTWPEGAPGGASIDAGGLIDWEGGGFHVAKRDVSTHEVHAVVTGDPAPACAAAGVAAPCLPVRTLPQARSRLITNKEWVDSLKGAILVEIPAPPLVAVAPSTVPYLQGAAALLGLGLVAAVGWTVARRRARSPAGQLLSLADRVRAKLKGADPVLAAPLAPAVDAAVAAVKRRRVDPASKEGLRVAEALRRIEVRIEAQEAAEKEQAADDLVREVESALEAADEMAPAARRVD
jgi:hypothetical protein